jgi:hypothetical protein
MSDENEQALSRAYRLPMLYTLDAHGEPVFEPDVIVWAQSGACGTPVAQDHVGYVLVSTVFIGLCNSRRQPLVFETMIFGGAHDRFEAHYATRAAALAGHAEALRMVTNDG